MADSEEVLLIFKEEGIELTESQVDSLTESIEDLTKAKEKDEDQTEDNAEVTENYSGIVDSATGTLDKFTGGMLSNVQAGAQSTKGLLTQVKALKGFKVALAATGIGLVVIAVGALATAFTRLQPGIDIASRILDQIGAVFGVILDRVGFLGLAIVELFQGNFQEAGALAKQAVDGIGESFETAIQGAGEAADRFVELEKAQIRFIERSAELNLIIKEQNRIAEDVTRSLEEREAAALKAIETQRTLANESIGLLEEEIAILELRRSLGENTREDDRELAELRAQIIEQRIFEEEQLTTLINKRNIIQTEARNAEFEASKERVQNIEIEKQAVAELTGIELKGITLTTEKRIQSEKDIAKVRAVEAKQRIDLAKNVGLAVLAVGTQLFEGSKGFAVANALINTYQAITNALATVPFPANIPVVAGVAAQGFAQVKKIVSTQPQAGGGAAGGGAVSTGALAGAATAQTLPLPASISAIPIGDNNLLTSQDEISAATENQRVVLYKDDVKRVDTEVEVNEGRATP